jgi:hypothetical protein
LYDVVFRSPVLFAQRKAFLFSALRSVTGKQKAGIRPLTEFTSGGEHFAVPAGTVLISSKTGFDE